MQAKFFLVQWVTGWTRTASAQDLAHSIPRMNVDTILREVQDKNSEIF